MSQANQANCSKLYEGSRCLTIRLTTFMSLKITAPQQGVSTEMSKVKPAGHEKVNMARVEKASLAHNQIRNNCNSEPTFHGRKFLTK